MVDEDCYIGAMRVMFPVLAAMLCVAATTPPPPVLLPYIQEGRFDPGDYGWLKGRFDDASPAEKAASARVGIWLDACLAADGAATRAELRAMGVTSPSLERAYYRDPLCAAVASAPYPLDLRSFARFREAVAAARPVADTYLAAIRTAEEVAGPRSPKLADTLLARPLADQMLRFGLGWGEGVMKDAPPLAPEVKAIVVARLGAELAERDRANTRWLRDIVAEQGWPTISAVGEPASAQAWLLIQHADADPAFQLRALRLMQPLTASGEVSRRNYAYLYDRVIMKLAGKQRYATQLTCENGRCVPLPLEDGKTMPTWRAEAGLEPFAAYLT
ncbi:DUF6624 domain-containing protein [uncultured Sphingomonas sp.]|uniref:DUF6624 domain-containing protein n=1 Tax=uncultured Sphingomonas sp. TaxID=158754 RepID=UPI0035C95C3F